MKKIRVVDIEGTGLIDETTVDYSSSPWKLKENFKVHCVTVQELETQKFVCFYNGPTYIFDGRPHIETIDGLEYRLEDYKPVEYEHKQLNEIIGYLKDVDVFVAHNGITYDMLVLMLYFGIDFTVCPDTLMGKPIEIVDTLVQSKTLNPDRYGGHSLDAWGERVGVNKIKFRHHLPFTERFKHFAADMLYYNIYDVKVNTLVFYQQEAEMSGWDWSRALEIEKSVAEIISRQQHRGFWYDKELALSNVKELDEFMAERKAKIDPILPDKEATKAYMKDFTPPVKQIKKNLELTSYMQKFLEKHDGKEVEGRDKPTVEIYGKEYSLPMALEPIVTKAKATIDDTTHIKCWLVKLGWIPTEFGERDLSTNSKKEKLSKEKYEEAVKRYVEQTLSSPLKDLRCEIIGVAPENLLSNLLNRKTGRAVKVPTNPKFTVGQEKEICPKLEAMKDKFPFATDIVEYLTYRHRRNSILGGGVGWDDDEEEMEKGFLSQIRDDGRIPTPADTCGAACVVADTLILTDKGTVPIVNVNVGDLVLTHNGVYGKVTDRVINGVKHVYQLSFESGNYVTATENHPFLTPKGWKRLDQLQTGEEVYYYQEAEKWGQVNNYSNYFISSWGRVMNTYGEFIKFPLRKALYDRANVDLVDDLGNKRRCGIGRLVLETFIGPPKEGVECCHKDGNPCNNFVNNLYWGTSKENSADAKIHGRSLKATRSNSKLKQEQINEIKEHFLHFGHKKGDDGRVAKKYGVSREYVRDIRLNKRWREGNTVNLYKEGFNLVKVESLCYKGIQPTFDLTVEDHHSYLANGVVCHNTSRFKHKGVANIPRCSSLYGHNMRAMFGVAENFLLMGYDFDSLEARIEAHYCYRYDMTEGKDYCRSLILPKPDDVHTKTAQAISEVLGKDFGRTPAKAVKYACTYGARAEKLAKTIGCDVATAEIVFDAFWQAALPLKNLITQLEKYWEQKADKKYILGIDGRKVPTRAKHAIANSLFQSAGVICAKKAMILHDRKLRAEGLSVDFWRDDWKSKKFVQQLIAYHN